MFFEILALENFTMFRIKKRTPAQVFTGEYYEIFKNTYFEEHPRMAAPEFCFESFEIKIAGKSFSRFCSYLAFLSFCKICKTVFFCYITSNVNFLKAAAEKIIETLIFFRENLFYCNITVKI